MNVTLLLDVLDASETTVYRTKAFQRLLVRYNVSCFVSVYPRVPSMPSMTVLNGYRCILSDATSSAHRTLEHLSAESLLVAIPSEPIPGFRALVSIAESSLAADPALTHGIAMTKTGTRFLEAARRMLLWLERNVHLETSEHRMPKAQANAQSDEKTSHRVQKRSRRR